MEAPEIRCRFVRSINRGTFQPSICRIALMTTLKCFAIRELTDDNVVLNKLVVVAQW